MDIKEILDFPSFLIVYTMDCINNKLKNRKIKKNEDKKNHFQQYFENPITSGHVMEMGPQCS